MPGRMTRTLVGTAGHVPGLRRVPILKILVLAELAVLAKAHLTKLDTDERHRLVELVWAARGRTSNLSPRQRRELRTLVDKAEPRLFAGTAVDKLSPVALPGRVLYGPAAKKNKKQQRG